LWSCVGTGTKMSWTEKSIQSKVAIIVVVIILQLQPDLGLKQLGQSVENLAITGRVIVQGVEVRVLPIVVEELRLILGTGSF
jgi:hypothetical protein